MPGHASRKSSFRLQQPAAGDQSPLYIYRPKASTPGLSKPLRLSYPEVFVDDRSVGSISCHRYLQIELEPGQHELRMTGLTGGARGWETRDIVRTLEIPAGRSSFPCCQVEYDM